MLAAANALFLCMRTFVFLKVPLVATSDRLRLTLGFSDLEWHLLVTTDDQVLKQQLPLVVGLTAKQLPKVTVVQQRSPLTC